LILLVTTSAEWSQQREQPVFASNTLGPEGFIHCCTPNQLKGVLERYFANVPDLLLLHIDESMITARLKYEAATGGELFPHVYGAIDKQAILRVENL
jgi:uncharacterized protein (DUF952 family)